MYALKWGWLIALLASAAVIAVPCRPSAAQDPQRQKEIDRLSRQLDKLRPVGTYKKDDDDFFVFGTAEVNQATRHADVRFEVKQGRRETAEFLVGFIAGASSETVRKWHVFYRLKDTEKADEAVQYTRQQYDQAVAYRQQLQRIYNATTMRRG